jgi:pSer/pThr/pTyr-binding forkhead associated (FHA) protein
MPGQYQLTLRSGPNPGTVFTLEGEQLTIGRDSSNEIAINDAEVSRRHATLSFQGGKYVIEDLGSTNGTFVNGQRLAAQRVLKSGEIITLGEKIELVYETVVVDPGATMVSSRKAAASRPAAAAPPPAPQAYAGQVPASPPEPASGKKTSPLPIVVIVGAVVLICACISFFWFVDANFLWCTFFPFLGGC